MDTEHLAPFKFLDATTALTPDPRLTGRIKWYVTPIVFGGDAAIGPNVIRVPLAEHAQLVRFWNEAYRKARSNAAKR